jgi:hypothetical protein
MGASPASPGTHQLSDGRAELQDKGNQPGNLHGQGRLPADSDNRDETLVRGGKSVAKIADQRLGIRSDKKKALEIARNLLAKGWAAEEVAETTDLPIEKVLSLVVD